MNPLVIPLTLLALSLIITLAIKAMQGHQPDKKWVLDKRPQKLVRTKPKKLKIKKGK